MPERAWQRDLGDALEAALREQARDERYARSPLQAARGGADPSGQAHPLEFDESGFPIPQAKPSFRTRVARLLRPF